MTFEITRLDYSPLEKYMVDAAAFLLDGKRVEIRKRKEHCRLSGSKFVNLKFDSRMTRNGDWILWAEDQQTKTWLMEFFQGDFSDYYRAMLVSERVIVKYGIRAQFPDSKNHTEAEIINFVMDTNRVPGWVRHHATTIRYKNPDLDKAFRQAVKNKKQDSFDDEDNEFTKLVMVKVCPIAHEFLAVNIDGPDFDLFLGVNRLQIFQVRTNNANSEANKRMAGQQGAQGGTPSRRAPLQIEYSGNNEQDRQDGEPMELAAQGEREQNQDDDRNYGLDRTAQDPNNVEERAPDQVTGQRVHENGRE